MLLSQSQRASLEFAFHRLWPPQSDSKPFSLAQVIECAAIAQNDRGAAHRFVDRLLDRALEKNFMVEEAYMGLGKLQREILATLDEARASDKLSGR